MKKTFYSSLKFGCDLVYKSFIEKKKIVGYVGGWLGQKNLGDESLYLATKYLFKKYDFAHFNGSRTQAFFLRCYPFIKNGLLAGGTLINQNPAWLKHANQFTKICGNLYVFGTGVANESFWSKQNKVNWVNLIDQWKILLEKCKYVGVRGPISAEILINAGVKNVQVVGDPVIALADQKINKTYVPNSIGLNIGQSRGLVWGSEENICNQFIRLARLAKKANWSIHWFVVWPDDLEITCRAANASETTENIYQIFDDPQQYKDLVRPLSVFVGMKLHTVILANCVFVPSIMLEYRPKCLDYMKSTNQEDCSIRTDKFSCDEIWEIVFSWNLTRNKQAEKIYKNVKLLQHLQQEQFSLLMKNMD